MAALMASMAVGGAVGQNIAGTMNNVMSGMNQTMQGGVGMTPPPIPKSVYHVAVNGQAAGPFDLNTLEQLIASSQVNVETLVWKNGMANWEKAGNVDELKALFVTMPPIPPQE